MALPIKLHNKVFYVIKIKKPYQTKPDSLGVNNNLEKAPWGQNWQLPA